MNDQYQREFARDMQRLIVNPFYCIEIHKDLCIPHETMVTRETWIDAMCNLVNEIGLEKALSTMTFI